MRVVQGEAEAEPMDLSVRRVVSPFSPALPGFSHSLPIDATTAFRSTYQSGTSQHRILSVPGVNPISRVNLESVCIAGTTAMQLCSRTYTSRHSTNKTSSGPFLPLRPQPTRRTSWKLVASLVVFYIPLVQQVANLSN